jgi:hypothetical protein
MFLFSLYYSKLKWNDLTPVFKQTLLSRIIELLTKSTSLTDLIGINFFFLKKLDFPWFKDSSYVNALFSCLSNRFETRFSSFTVNSSFSLEYSELHVLLQQLTQTSDSTFLWSNLSHERHDILVKSVKKAISVYPPESLHKLIKSFHDLGITSAVFHNLLHKSLFPRLKILKEEEQRKGNSNLPIEVTSTLMFDFGLTHLKWGRIPVEIQSLLIPSFFKDGIYGSGLSRTLFGLAMMEFRPFRAANADFRAIIIRGIDTSGQKAPSDGKEQEHQESLATDVAKGESYDRETMEYIANAVWALGSMAFQWKELPTSSIEKAIQFDKYSQYPIVARDISNITYGLMKMGTSWESLEAGTCEVLNSYTRRTRHVFDIQVSLFVFFSVEFPIPSLAFPLYRG